MSDNRNTVIRLVQFDIHEQSESDAFLKRIAECKSQEEVRAVVDGVRSLLTPERINEDAK